MTQEIIDPPSIGRALNAAFLFANPTVGHGSLSSGSAIVTLTLMARKIPSVDPAQQEYSYQTGQVSPGFLPWLAGDSGLPCALSGHSLVQRPPRDPARKKIRDHGQELAWILQNW